MNENKPGRRLLSFGIRDLLWVMVVMGLAVALWMQHQQNSRLRAENLHLQEANAFSARVLNRVLQQSTAK